MNRHFLAEVWFNCAKCEDIVEPGDEAGYARAYPSALCLDCLVIALEKEEEERW